jgi:putative membrane protein
MLPTSWGGTMQATPFIPLLLLASLLHTPPPAQAVSEDQMFVTLAVKDGQAEVNLATLAQTKAGSEQTRTLASELRADHDRANAELMAIARRKGIAVDPAPGDEQRQVATKLADLTGTDFDRAYTDEMMQAHQRAMQLFEDFSHTGSDPELKAFAARVLPTLRHHLEMARSAHGIVAGTR